MGISFRHPHRMMAQKLFYRDQVNAERHEPRGKGVPKIMEAKSSYPRVLDGPAELPFQVMEWPARLWICKNKWRSPLPAFQAQKNSHQGVICRDHTGFAALSLPDPDGAVDEINLIVPQSQDLSFAHPRMQGGQDYRAESRRTTPQQLSFLFIGQDSLLLIVLLGKELYFLDGIFFDIAPVLG